MSHRRAAWVSTILCGLVLLLVGILPVFSQQEQESPRRIRVRSGVQEGKRTHYVRPEYPEIARRARIEGTVRLEAIIGQDGTVKNLRVVEGHPLLVQAAVVAVPHWRNEPTLLEGEPVEVVTYIDIVFRLTSEEEPEQKPASARETRWETLMADAAKAYQQADYAKAEKLFRAALKEAEKFGEQDPRLGFNHLVLGRVYQKQGHYAQAEQFNQRALAILEKALGPEHPQVATLLENYAALLHKLNRDAQADKIEARAQAIRAKHAQENPQR